MLVIICVVLALLFVGISLLTDPYLMVNVIRSPYRTQIADGKISYEQVYKPLMLTNRFFDYIGYIKSGILILRHRYFGSRPLRYTSADKILKAIYSRRFNPDRPYLISGDQFSVLYPRNLGVFYNRLLSRDIASNADDYERRQRIYLQSVLIAIDGLSQTSTPKTTIVPIAPRIFTVTQVHPGGVASDAVYGVFFALDKLLSQPATKKAARRILTERRSDLERMLACYTKHIQDPKTNLVFQDKHLASARDGVVRSSSFYDNVVLWATLTLATKLKIDVNQASNLHKMRSTITKTYWQEEAGYYANDVEDAQFSSDFLIGYVTGFFDLKDTKTLARSKRIIDYIESQGIADPLPIKYQKDSAGKAPIFVRLFVPSYGTNAIWSYWGCEYITLLANVYHITKDARYRTLAKHHLAKYAREIVKNGGFPEVFTQEGVMLKNPYYKSILHTGWAVQYDYARWILKTNYRFSGKDVHIKA